MSSSYKVKSLDNKMLDLNKIGIIYNIEHKGAIDVVEKLEATLNKNGFHSVIKQIAPEKGKPFRDYDKNIDLAIIIGGDGTLLGAARFYAPLEIPVFGINIGRLGFLSQLVPEEIDEGIKKLKEGKFKIEERLMMQASDSLDNPTFSFSGLNDIVIKGGSISRTAQLFLYIDGKHVCDYVADGLIVSTPTGSTAYNLSAGGPVMVPELDAIIIAPICPHSLTSRPIIVPACEKLMVKVSSKADLIYLTADGQEHAKLDSSSTIYINESKYKAKLILLEREESNFYRILREKLQWGVSPGS